MQRIQYIAGNDTVDLITMTKAPRKECNSDTSFLIA